MKENLKQAHLHILDQAKVINAQCSDTCFDFSIMTSELHTDTLILRWLEIDIRDINCPIQQYRYRCFNLDGSPQHCSIHYSNQQEANAFFKGLVVLHTQDYANDHELL